MERYRMTGWDWLKLATIAACILAAGWVAPPAGAHHTSPTKLGDQVQCDLFEFPPGSGQMIADVQDGDICWGDEDKGDVLPPSITDDLWVQGAGVVAAGGLCWQGAGIGGVGCNPSGDELHYLIVRDTILTMNGVLGQPLFIFLHEDPGQQTLGVMIGPGPNAPAFGFNILLRDESELSITNGYWGRVVAANDSTVSWRATSFAGSVSLGERFKPGSPRHVVQPVQGAQGWDGMSFYVPSHCIGAEVCWDRLVLCEGTLDIHAPLEVGSVVANPMCPGYPPTVNCNLPDPDDCGGPALAPYLQ